MRDGESSMSAGFAHLHCHTEYSVLDGACKIHELLDKCKEFGMTSCAITDHGVLFGAVEFYQAAKKAGIKPIIGSELYVSRTTRGDRSARGGNSSTPACWAGPPTMERLACGIRS